MRLKIWTIVTHALVLVGAGHGILFLVVIEIGWFPYFSDADFTFSFDKSVQNHFPVVGLLSLVGQIAIVISIFHKSKVTKLIFQVSGLIILWTSIVYFGVDASRDSYTHIAYLTCLPFLICTIITFAGPLIQKSFKRIWGWALK